MKIFTEIIEGASILLILLAYTFLNFNLLTSQSFAYHSLNFFGAVGIVFISYKKKIFQPIVLNIIWAIVAIIGVILML